MMPLNRIAALIKQSIGMDAETTGHLSLANAVRARMTACKVPELYDYRVLLEGSGEELAQLIELVVVPETWFFRVPEAFTALIHLVQKEWVPAHPGGRLRILSAPCSTGEEPYSIAMALLNAGFAPSGFRIDAMDISSRALDQARRATYGRNSFRGGDPGLRERHFHEIPGGHRLNDTVRGCVEFRQANLVTGDLLSGAGDYDVIFCRNVLIYFDTATQERVIHNFRRLLTPEGLLFVGPAETFVARTAGFVTADFPGAFVCRRSEWREDSPPPFTAASLTPSPQRREPVKAAPQKPPVRATPPAARPSLQAKPLPREISPLLKNNLDGATTLANAGRLPEAFSMCEAYLREQGPSADAYHLLGLIRDIMGDPQEAAKFYRKSLYLEPNHHDALLHLALLEEKQGDFAGARRLQLRAQRSMEANIR